jgi:hypothetical protein
LENLLILYLWHTEALMTYQNIPFPA